MDCSSRESEDEYIGRNKVRGSRSLVSGGVTGLSSIDSIFELYKRIKNMYTHDEGKKTNMYVNTIK